MIRRSLLAVVVVAVGVVTPSAAQPLSQLLQKGIYTQDTVGDVDAALALFRQVLKAPNPPRRDAAQAHARIVQCLAQKGDHAEAAHEFDRLTREYPDFKDIIAAAATVLYGRVPARESVQLVGGPTRLLSVIRGRVTDDTGRPLRAAQIRLSAVGGGIEPRTVDSDDDGRYDVTDVRAGRYTVTVNHAGYLSLRYGQRRPRELGKLLDIVNGQTLDNVDFMLPRMSAIAGRLTDETKEPVADALVFAMRSVYFDGRRQFVPTGSGPLVRTDDDGEFRLGGLMPGTYIVVAHARDTWSVDEGGVEQIGYAPTYYPDTVHVSSAREIAVALGQEIDHLDFALVPMRTATISGTAVDSHRRPFTMIALADEFRGEGFGYFSAVARARVGADGRFSIPHVPAGHYKLEASTLTAAGNSVDPPEIAIRPIDVNGVDIDNVTLIGSSGGSVAGTVVTDSGVLPTLHDVRIRIERRLMGQPEPLMLGTFDSNRIGVAEVKDDGSFTMEHVFGPARIQVAVPDGWAVKAIRHSGEDISDAVLDFASGQPMSGVQIVLTRRVTTITGQVVDARNVPTPEGTVVVFSTDRDKLFEDSRHIRAVRPDQHGRYEIRGLPSGQYLIAAVDDVDQGAWWDPEFLNAIQPSAQLVTLGDAASVTETLTLVRR